VRDPVLWRTAVAAVALGVLAWTAAFAADRVLGRDVVLVVPYDDAEAETRRALWRADGSPRTARDVAAVHGQVLGEVRAVAPRADRLVRPEEDPAVALLLVEPRGGRPLQARTLYYAAKVGAAVLAAAALLALAARRRGASDGHSATRSKIAKGDDASKAERS
jgi:hypothetical protein